MEQKQNGKNKFEKKQKEDRSETPFIAKSI